MPRKPRAKCLTCGEETIRPSYKYCSNVCQHSFQYRLYLKSWRAGKVSGLQSNGTVSPHVKRYLREKFNNRCAVCGWAKINPKTKKVPLVADHIDGNWKNNREENLRLVCPNCDSLSPTYAALNKGNGRKNRALSKRAMEGRLLRASFRNKSVVV